MAVEQIDIFQQAEVEKRELQAKIFQAITAASQRIEGGITEGHLKAMIVSVLENEVGVLANDQAKMEIDISIQAADGNRNKIDYQLLAAKIADAVERHT